jgi:hypothetical protein
MDDKYFRNLLFILIIIVIGLAAIVASLLQGA